MFDVSPISCNTLETGKAFKKTPMQLAYNSYCVVRKTVITVTVVIWKEIITYNAGNNSTEFADVLMR